MEYLGELTVLLNSFQLLVVTFQYGKQLMNNIFFSHSLFCLATCMSLYCFHRHGITRRMMLGPWTQLWARDHWQRVHLLTLRCALQMPPMQRCVHLLTTVLKKFVKNLPLFTFVNAYC